MKTTMTEGGQVSIPIELQREMQLVPGQTLIWQRISSTECRVIVAAKPKVTPDPVGALGFAKKHGLETMPTDEWMMILREAEED